jgi:hypothetical protein
LEFLMPDSNEFLSRDDAAAFIAACRKIRGGMDDFSVRMDGLAAAANCLSQDCHTLAGANPHGAGELAKILPVIAAILSSLGRTVGETGNNIRAGADEFSRKLRALELDARKGTH